MDIFLIELARSGGRRLAGAQPEDLVEFTRVADLRDGKSGWGQFCIDKVLGHALAGDVRKGLFFRGAGRLPFGTERRSARSRTC